MRALAIHEMEELSQPDAVAVRGGNPAALGAAVAIAGLMVTGFGAGFRFGYDVLGPWLAQNVF
jgi:hypothetical protein